ncbi:MAG: hypothetical protein LBI32_05745 [Myroides odoratus]|jgi:hypothetical protein|nr:hypothetical protein [Myroides odoratus]
MKELAGNKYAFILICFFSILVGIVSSLVLPEKFFFDAQIISEDPNNEIGWLGGSYPFTISFYHLFGLNKVPYSVVALLQLPILCYLLNKIGVPKDFHRLTVRNIFLYISFILLGVFIGQPSKEFLSFVIVACIVFIIQSKKIALDVKVVSILLVFLITGALFRPYYLLMPFLICGMWFIGIASNRQYTGLKMLISGVVILFCFSFFFYFLKGNFLSEVYREQLNDLRRGEDYAQSIITSPLRPLTYLNEMFSILYGIISVNIPVIHVKMLLKPQIGAFVIWQLLLDWFLIQACITPFKQLSKYKTEVFALLLCLSFFLIQGIFEPDLGSAVRHKIGFFPILYYFIIYGKEQRTK